MRDKLLIGDMPALIETMGAYMDQRRAELAELDSLTGDGDMGVTIALIVRAAGRYGKTLDEDISFSEFFGDLAEAIGEYAPSTFGTFVSTMLASIAERCGEINGIDGAVYANMLAWAAEGVMKRGGAKRGDKTLLDALIPAAEAAGRISGETLPKACEAAKEAAAKGAEETVAMKAATGRAGYMGERTVGNRDPGAEAVSQMLAAFAEFVVR